MKITNLILVALIVISAYHSDSNLALTPRLFAGEKNIELEEAKQLFPGDCSGSGRQISHKAGFFPMDRVYRNRCRIGRGSQGPRGKRVRFEPSP